LVAETLELEGYTVETAAHGAVTASDRVRLGRVAAETAETVQGRTCALCGHRRRFAAEFILDYPGGGLSICEPCADALHGLYDMLGPAPGQTVQLSLLVEPQDLRRQPPEG
jgi:hypothetical protein